jgi:outer membrane protein TolC
MGNRMGENLRLFMGSHSTTFQTGTHLAAALRMAVAFALVAGCVSCLSTRRLDTDVHDLVTRTAETSMPGYSNTLADAVAVMAPDRRVTPAQAADLGDVLRLATRHSRELQKKREALYLGGLDRLAALRDFGPQLSGTLDYVLRRPENGNDGEATTLRAKASQVLPTGGTLSAEGQAGAEDASATNGPTQYDRSASLELRQPLLAGSGYEASHAALIQSERDLVYALRAFALERQDFAIGIMKSYYSQLIQGAVLENTRQTVDQSVFLRRRSEALFRIRRAPSIDVLRSQQQELSASNAFNQAAAQYDVDRRRFLIELGVPVDVSLTVTGRVPDLRPMDLNIDTCVVMAMERRLDLRTAEDNLEDARRGLRIARRDVLPQLDAFGKATAVGQSAESVAEGDNRNDYSAGVSLAIPFDKRPERDAVKRALITVDAAERSVTEKRDSIHVSILDSFQTLQSQRVAAGIEFRNMDIAERQAAYAALRFRNGEADNRDVVDAQNQLLNARNTYVRALVQYEQQRIQLLRDIGLLDVAADGTLVEMKIP